MLWAARNGRLAVLQWLVGECGCDVNGATGDGTTAFHWAVWQGHKRAAAWLVGAGADPKALNAYGGNAVQART